MGKNLLYLESYAGFTGDMAAAALLDLGVDEKALAHLLSLLPFGPISLIHGKTKKQGVFANTFEVMAERNSSYCLTDIWEMLDQLPANPEMCQMAKEMFLRLGAAVARTCGVPEKEVLFQESEAVELLAAAYCFDQLHIGEVILSPLYEGQVSRNSGPSPISIAAARTLMETYGIPFGTTNMEGEAVTGVGAVIASLLWKGRTFLPPCQIQKTGIGAGKSELSQTNLLRASLIHPIDGAEEIWVLETNLDDCSGEALGYTLEKLGEAGVRDAFFIPVFMKKNRPAVLLTVVCDREKISEAEQIIFTHTTTIGIRKHPVERRCLKRTVDTVETPWGAARVKCCRAGETTWNYPEYEDIRRICNESGESFGEVYRLIQNLAEKEEI
ncbi:LarC family nickel insertion protein [Hominifimenecus sp. rT4P-3]|uniref:LarC family nickel insertion protein n=1 Tax=Hominifimenecus sp. rT4P-3 TaxID=3242979 RepID=UPI003DA2AB14